MTETARGSAEDHERAEARCFSTAHGRGRAEPAGFEREVFFLHGGDEILVLWPEIPQKIRGD